MFGTDRWKKVSELFASENNKLTQKTWENASTRAFPPGLVTKDYSVCLHWVSLLGFCLKHCPFSHPVSTAPNGVFTDLPKHFSHLWLNMAAIFPGSSRLGHFFDWHKLLLILLFLLYSPLWSQLWTPPSKFAIVGVKMSVCELGLWIKGRRW